VPKRALSAGGCAPFPPAFLSQASMGRTPIDFDQLKRFTVDGAAPIDSAPAKTAKSGNNAVPKTLRQIDYNVVDPGLQERIDSVEILGSYGSKIEALVKHILHVQQIEAGAKNIGEWNVPICSSAWTDIRVP
jgi:hypothetical protein